MNFAIVALGGALGAMARYGISLHLPSLTPAAISRSPR